MSRLRLIVFLACLVPALAGAVTFRPASSGPMPYTEAGLTERQAAAHLLERFTFGPTPGLVDDVVSAGLENWFAGQLEAGASSDALDRRLSRLKTLDLSNDEIASGYPRPGRIRRQMIEEGRLDPDLEPKEQRQLVRDYYEEKGYQQQRKLLGELIAQKVLRAAESPNQVREVMVDFWFNHFYVSATDNQCRRYVGTYERDAIRPYVFASVGAMLGATAKHPAMLRYLDNAQSSAAEDAATTASLARERLQRMGGAKAKRYEKALKRAEQGRKRRERQMAEGEQPRRRRGINENYARELLELHTLGVDGGYTQDDVEGVARALTGWTVVPEGERGKKVRARLDRNRALGGELGFAIDGDFFFNAEWHDAGQKQILDVHFARGGGLQEGEAVLKMLATHPSTARHIAHKLSVRFVGDTPPQSFVDNLTGVFEQTGGDMRALLWQIVRSPEFWDHDAVGAKIKTPFELALSDAVGAKIKTPFELALSSVRGLDADVRNPRELVRWIERMGQPLYRYQAPTGFPDRADMWVNAGSLLHRMNFGLSLAAGEVKGVRVDLTGFQGGRAAESIDGAIEAWAAILLPERDLGGTVKALRPAVEQPGEKISKPSQVVGLILGSPEFQRR